MATPQARLRDFLPNARDLAALIGVRGLAGIIAWSTGFRALSDDDYARITIAQRFAQARVLDPSGTSWLPAPFWVYGALFRCLGSELFVARGTAIGLGLCATVTVYVAARILFAGRVAALWGATLSCLVVPYSLLLGIAAVPEVPCAALLLFAVATLTRPELALRSAGGVALIAATLSRYEAWPVALIFACYCAWDARRRKRIVEVGPAVLALVGPAFWLALGHAQHGDALFFIGRVTAYRRALGGLQTSILSRLSDFPVALVRDGWAIFALLIVAWLSTRKGEPREDLPYRRPLFAALAMLAFLMLGSVQGGVPTHHAARVLLPIWYFGCVAAGHALAQSTAVESARYRVVIALVLGAPSALLFAAGANDFAARSPELEAGRAARRYTASDLAIDTPDYGYFAVQAGFGSPLGTSVLDDHDPRHQISSPFGSRETVDQALHAQGARFAVVTKEHAASLPPRCASRWANQRFVLFSCATGRH